MAALRASPGLGAARFLMLAELDTALGGRPKLTSYGLLCGWRDGAARDEFLDDGTHLRPMLEGASEAWNLSLDTVRAVRGDWWGWKPRTAGVARLGPREPVLVMTYGLVHWRHMPVFMWRNRQIVRHVARDPAMTLRVGFLDTAEARGTLSLWRSQQEMLSFAYRSQPHDPVQREAIRVPWAEGFFFARFRPVAAAGTWGGRDPLAELRRSSESGPGVVSTDALATAAPSSLPQAVTPTGEPSA